MSEDFNRIRERLLKAKPSQFTSDLTCVTALIKEAGFKTLKEFITSPVGQGGLGMELKQVEKLIWFNPSYKHEAKRLINILGLAERAKQVPVLNDAKHSSNQHSLGDESKKVTKQRGNDSDYRISKLKRDNPDVALRLEQGEFKNVAEAERVAGVKPPKREGKRLHMYKDDMASAVKAIEAYYGKRITEY